jgi:hypothetical protein
MKTKVFFTKKWWTVPVVVSEIINKYKNMLGVNNE